MASFISCLKIGGLASPFLTLFLQNYKIMFKLLKNKWENIKEWFNKDHHCTIEIEISDRLLIFIAFIIIGILWIIFF